RRGAPGLLQPLSGQLEVLLRDPEVALIERQKRAMQLAPSFEELSASLELLHARVEPGRLLATRGLGGVDVRPRLPELGVQRGTACEVGDADGGEDRDDADQDRPGAA